MTSVKKPLIAIATAAALAITSLVAIPAIAAAPSITVGSAVGGSGTSESPFTINVPYNNNLEGDVNAIKLTVTNLEADDVVTVTTTGSVKIVDSSEDVTRSKFLDITSLHKSSVSKARTNGDQYRFHVQTTSTGTGTVVVGVSRVGISLSKTYHIQGIAGPKYFVKDVSGVPATLAKTKTIDLTFKVTDVFGNLVENKQSDVRSGALKTNLGDPTWDAEKKVYKTTLTSPNSGAFVADLDLSATDIPGFADSNASFAVVVNYAGDSNLRAQVSELNVKLANSVSKKKYNKLARKWNRAFPASKVKLIK
jgi:hypothetical protein